MQQLITEHHEIPIGTLTQTVIVVTMSSYNGKGVDLFSLTDVVLQIVPKILSSFLLKLEPSCSEDYYLAVKISKTSAAP